MHRLLATLALLSASSLALSACTSDNPEITPEDYSSPISVDNCGFEIHLQPPIQRATTLEQGATDTLLLLGAKNQMAGYGHQKDAPPAGYSLDGLEEISPSVPNSEQLRDADTDFIYSPFALSWTADGAGSREEWANLGVGTYQSNVECPDHADNAGKSTFDLINKDITELGIFFDREKDARKLVTKQQEALKNAAQAPEGTTFMLLYSSIGGAPYVAGGPSIVTEIGEATGMNNVFGDLKEEWPQISWEAVAEADPDVILLADLPERGEPGDKWEEKVTALKETPGTKKMAAVKNDSFIVVPGVATSASGRSYEVLEKVSAAIDGELFAEKAK